MKKIALVLAAAALVFAACSNGADSAGFVSGGSGGTQSGGGVTVDDDGIVTINSKNLKYIGEGTETVDAVEYKVKKYADLLLDDNPYFYTYYKFYYLDGKLRRVYTFDHGEGSDMDYKYDEFVEHSCNIVSSNFQCHIYTYYENGKIESATHYSEISPNMPAGTLSKDCRYYYTNGYLKCNFYRSNTGEITYFRFYYSSGYLKYYYCDGNFYTYADNTTKDGYDDEHATLIQTLTPAQAEAKLAELMNE